MTPNRVDAEVLAAAPKLQNPDGALLTEADREDIQALILFGTKSPFLRYHFFAVRDSRRACEFVDFLLTPGPLAINTAGTNQSDKDREHLVYAGFTWQGLAALGLDPLTLDSFPVEFR